MYITWLGHACFCLEEEGYRLVLDPYTGVPGYPPLKVQAHNLLCSHAHDDHSHIGGVILLPPQQSPFDIRTVAAFHDEANGAQRGANTIHVISAGGVTVAHLGDLGHALTAELLAEIGECDGVLLPVGGTYTVDAKGAYAAAMALSPRVIVPMHYRHGDYGLREVGEVEDFLDCFSKDAVVRLNHDGFFLTAGDGRKGVLVPRYPA